jgi:hypothetical protein
MPISKALGGTGIRGGKPRSEFKAHAILWNLNHPKK